MFSNVELTQKEWEEYLKKQRMKNLTIAILAVACFVLLCLTILFSELFLEKNEVSKSYRETIEQLDQEKQQKKKLTTTEETEEVESFFSKGFSVNNAYLMAYKFPEIIGDDWTKNDLSNWYLWRADNLKNEIRYKVLEHPNCPVSIYWQAAQDGSVNTGYKLIRAGDKLPLELKTYLATKHPQPYIRAIALEEFHSVIPLEMAIKRYYEDRWPVVTEAILRSYDLPVEIYRHAVNNLYHHRLARGLMKNGVPEDVIESMSNSRIKKVREIVAYNSKSQKILENLAQGFPEEVIFNTQAGAQALSLAGEKILENYYGASERLYFYSAPIERLLVHKNAPYEMRKKVFPIVMRYERFKNTGEAFKKLVDWHNLQEGDAAYSFLKSKAEAEKRREE